MTTQVEIENVGPSDLPAAGTNNPTPIVIAVTTSSVHIDLTGTGYDLLLNAIQKQKLLVLAADSANVWYRWSPATSGGTVDETMTAVGGTPADQAAILFSGSRAHLPERPPPNTKGLIVKGASATKLRLWWIA